MNKFILLLLLFLFYLHTNAQVKRHSKIFLKNGDVVLAEGRLISDEFIYKENGEKKIIPFSDIDYVQQRNKLNNTTETYRQFKVRKTESTIVLLENIYGPVSLYSYSDVNIMANGMVTRYVYYYLHRAGEDTVMGLDREKYFRINFNKAAALYFKDCPELVKKLNNKEFKRRHLKRIVNFFNTSCNN